MLAAELIVQPVVNVNLVETIPIRERSAGQIDGRLRAVEQHIGSGFIIGGEDDTVPGVGDCAAYLRTDRRKHTQ